MKTVGKVVGINLLILLLIWGACYGSLPQQDGSFAVFGLSVLQACCNLLAAIVLIFNKTINRYVKFGMFLSVLVIPLIGFSMCLISVGPLNFH